MDEKLAPFFASQPTPDTDQNDPVRTVIQQELTRSETELSLVIATDDMNRDRLWENVEFASRQAVVQKSSHTLYCLIFAVQCQPALG